MEQASKLSQVYKVASFRDQERAKTITPSVSLSLYLGTQKTLTILSFKVPTQRDGRSITVKSFFINYTKRPQQKNTPITD